MTMKDVVDYVVQVDTWKSVVVVVEVTVKEVTYKALSRWWTSVGNDKTMILRISCCS